MSTEKCTGPCRGTGRYMTDLGSERCHECGGSGVAVSKSALPLPEALSNDEWNARRNELEKKVETAARALLDFSQGAAGIRMPFDGFVVTIKVTP